MRGIPGVHPKKGVSLDEVYELNRRILWKLETILKEIERLEMENKVIMNKLGCTVDDAKNIVEETEA